MTEREPLPTPPQTYGANAPAVPARLFAGRERPDAFAVLQEAPEAQAMLLWSALRTVTLWTDTPAAEHAGLFAAAEAEADEAADAELRGALETISRLRRQGDETPPGAVAAACDTISRWAVARELRRTALAFSLAAASVCPGDAALAYTVGRVARLAGRVALAESGFRRALVLGGRGGAPMAEALAMIGLGNVARHRGNLPGARRMHARALRAARAHGLPRVEGMALHELFVICAEKGRVELAQRYAAEAIRLYEPVSPPQLRMMHDVAYLWMENGFFVEALAVFRALLPYAPHVLWAPQLAASTARAAGGAGLGAEMDRAWVRAWERLPAGAPVEGTAAALLDLARGAASMGEWARAEQAAQGALDAATQVGEGMTLFAAEALLEHVRRSRAASARRPDDSRSAHASTTSMVDDIVRVLEAAGAAA
jgi:tetratricopeptide (TPR) repeat protein